MYNMYIGDSYLQCLFLETYYKRKGRIEIENEKKQPSVAIVVFYDWKQLCCFF